jgi:AcrR family transcriptional regulator
VRWDRLVVERGRAGAAEAGAKIDPVGAARRESEQADLVSAAREMFRERGYAGTHIASIAKAAGVSLSTFYARFGSKEQAWRDVMGDEPPSQAGAGRAPTARARRTRAALVAATWACVERDGYHAVRISDIAEQAGTSVGSFYTHFSSKQEAFTAVLEEAIAAIRDARPEPTRSAVRSAATPQERRERAVARIREAIERYYDDHDRFAIMTLRADEAVSVHPELMPLRLAAHRASADRIAGSLRRWQAAGLIDPDLDPAHTADALAAMAGHATRVWLTYGQDHDRDVAISTLVRLWVNGIGLDAPTP